jgi:hypothetical protein
MAIARHGAAEIGEALVARFRAKGTAATALLLKAENRGISTDRSADPGRPL